MKKIMLNLAGIGLAGLLAFGCTCPVKAPEEAAKPEWQDSITKLENELNGLKSEVEALKTQVNQLKVDVTTANEAAERAVTASQKAIESANRAEEAAQRIKKIRNAKTLFKIGGVFEYSP